MPRNRKVSHVLQARQTRTHECHWPECGEQVPPAKWGCRYHWYCLPRDIRNEIWRAYIPGQEETINPSRQYVAAARRAQDWILQHGDE